MKKGELKIYCLTINQAGIVIPYNFIIHTSEPLQGLLMLLSMPVTEW